MSSSTNIDDVLITWGDRLFYPSNRMIGAGQRALRAAALRRRIEATVARRAPQVMVKVTGGGRGMRAIAAHFRYISKNGSLEMEDQRGDKAYGKAGVRELVEEWKFGGALIPDSAEPGHRREAFNLMLSMPRGTDPVCVRRAARQFCRTVLDGHKWVLVLHDHQANPHVHVSVRSESSTGRRLNPRKADLRRWRETFAERLREYGIEAEASSRLTRSATKEYSSLWRVKAKDAGRLRRGPDPSKEKREVQMATADARLAWAQLSSALASSSDPADLDLARKINAFTTGLANEWGRAPEYRMDRHVPGR
jgi:hypothetical protein